MPRLACPLAAFRSENCRIFASGHVEELATCCLRSFREDYPITPLILGPVQGFINPFKPEIKCFMPLQFGGPHTDSNRTDFVKTSLSYQKA